MLDGLIAKGFKHFTIPAGDVYVAPHISAPHTYSQPVIIAVPKGFKQVDRVVVHFHGHRGICEPSNITPEKFIHGYYLLEQLVDQKMFNTVLVMPISLGKCETFEKELAPFFPQFRDWISDSIEHHGHDWIISGHSGAYRTIGTIMHNSVKMPDFIKKLDGIIFLDATYTSGKEWVKGFQDALLVQNPRCKIFSVYRDGGGTYEGSHLLQTSMPKGMVTVMQSSTNAHCLVPNLYFGKLLSKVIAVA